MEGLEGKRRVALVCEQTTVGTGECGCLRDNRRRTDFLPVMTEVNRPIARPYEPSPPYGRVDLEACGKLVLRSPACPLLWGDSREAAVTAQRHVSFHLWRRGLLNPFLRSPRCHLLGIC